MGGSAHRDRRDLDARLDPLIGQLLGLIANTRLTLVFIGVEIGAALGGDALFDMSNHDLAATLPGEFDCHRGGSLRVL